jgi:hypothetical protein
MRRQLSVMFAGLGLLLAMVPVVAHHAFSAEFDATRPIKFEGVLTKVEWINPHAWLHLDVKKPDGKIESWMIEMGAPNALFRRGFTKNSLVVGSTIVISGYQAKDGDTRGNGRDITFADGKKLFVGSSGTGAPDERPEK